MRECKECKLELNEDKFYKKDKGKRLASICKNCFMQYCTKRWRKIKEEAVSYKGGKCEQCGYNKCIDAFDFHHIDPKEKEYDWRRMRRKSRDIMFKELDKCMLLCANCHREIHFNLKTY